MSNVALMSHALEEARSVGAAANQVSAAPLGAAAAEPMPTRDEVESISSAFLPAAPPSSFWLPQINRTEERQQQEEQQQQQGEDHQQQQQQPVCSSCNGYYGPAFSQPVCATCHAFLYANDLDAEVNLHAMTMQEEAGVGDDGDGMGGDGGGGGGDGDGGHGHGHDHDDSDRDSGNEEPMEDVADQQDNLAMANAEDEGNVDVEEVEDEEEGEGDQGDVVVHQDGEQNGDQEEGIGGEAAAADAGVAPPPPHPPVVVAVNQLPPEPSPEDGNQVGVEDEVAMQEEGLVGAVADIAPAAQPFSPPPPPQPPWENLMLPWDVRPVPLPPARGGGGGHSDGGAAAAAASARASFKVESLSQRLALLSFPRPSDKISEGIVADLPPEVLLYIFSFLDDLTLYAVGNVCRRWNIVLNSQVLPEQWQTFTRRRWPLFRPISRVRDWFTTFSALVESSFCLTCIYQMAELIPADYYPLPLREKRLVHDLRLLVEDPPPGIKAQPLDSSNYHWQASITGPAGSPYEGGMFFLYLKVPFTFPFDPPEVRFLTRIFHPNVSRHGDIGMDSILQHNWVSGLTIPKVLISIQSLLTDPYTAVCMEPEIGELYRTRRKLFDAVARRWTWQFAMHDAIPPQPKEGLGRLGATGGASRSGGAFASAFRKAEEAEEDLEEAAGSSDFA